MKVGFIGIGNMGGAVARAVAKRDHFDLLLTNHNQEKAEKLKQDIGGDILSNQDIIQEADVIFLGLKPHLIMPFLEENRSLVDQAKDTVWISMAAGLSTDRLSQVLDADQLIRMMPNTPVSIGSGMTTFSTMNPNLVALFEDLMAESGSVKILPEADIDAASALAGCGPAFVYQFIESLIDAGIQNGLSYEDSKTLASQTLIGASQMVQESGLHPGELRHQVTSPGGTTIAGVVALEQNNFRYAVIDAVNQAVAKNSDLDK